MKSARLLAVVLGALLLPATPVSTFAVDAGPATDLRLSWKDNLLTIAGSALPAGKVEIWYLEAFCRTGAHARDWAKTTLPHKTELLSSSADGKELHFRTMVEPSVEVRHDIVAVADGIEIQFSMKNHGGAPVDVQWFQPACVRVAAFTGRDQQGFTARSFIFTSRGLTPLAETVRREEALYRGGQVYVPAGIAIEDANPRPVSADQPVNGLIGCFSGDDKYLLATASDRTHELFEGVYVCLHSDPHIGGLGAGETKTCRSKIYLLENDVPLLLRKYERDFPKE